MAFLGQQFNTDELPEGRGFEPLPPGWYDAEIIKAEVKPTKAGDGTRLNVQYKITGSPDGKYIGRVVFGAMNIELSRSPKAEEIGRQQLGDLLKAIGIPAIEDSDELVGYAVRIRLKIREQEGFEPSNEPSGWKPVGDAPAAPQRPAQRPVPSQAANSAGASRAAPAPAARPAARAAAAPAAGGKKPPPWARK